MSNHEQQQSRSSEASIYQICIRGQLDQAWTDWFEGLEIALDTHGDTLLIGTIIDQAALFGLIKKIRDLGMHLISIMPVDPSTLESNSSEQ